MTIAGLTIPTIMTGLSALAFFVLERLRPGRELPKSRHWYVRAVLINFCQLAITLMLARIWMDLYGSKSLLDLKGWESPVLEGFVGWFVGTFIFYWWHRIRHLGGFWQIFHQIHHSASRIEILTSFYKHPVEIAVNSLLTAAILFPLLGCSVMASFWYNFFAATGEFFYHGNYRSPKWLRYFIQTPELHSIHHQLHVHNYNFADTPIWDRIFGTYKDTTVFVDRCGFDDNREEQLGKMLLFRDVNSAGDV